eukprot:scaffold3694_cov104-Isochrysis_galbana.AAC.3
MWCFATSLQGHGRNERHERRRRSRRHGGRAVRPGRLPWRRNQAQPEGPRPGLDTRICCLEAVVAAASRARRHEPQPLAQQLARRAGLGGLGDDALCAGLRLRGDAVGRRPAAAPRDALVQVEPPRRRARGRAAAVCLLAHLGAVPLAPRAPRARTPLGAGNRSHALGARLTGADVGRARALPPSPCTDR